MDKKQKQLSKGWSESFNEASDLEFSNLIAKKEDETNQTDNEIPNISGMECDVFWFSRENLPAEIEKAKLEIEEIKRLGHSAGVSLLKRSAVLELVVEILTYYSKMVESNAQQKIYVAQSAGRHLIELDDEWPNVTWQ